MINVSSLITRWGLVGALCAFVLIQTGCQTGNASYAGSGTPDESRAKLATTAPIDANTNSIPGLDLLRVGDKLTIDLTDTPIQFTPREEKIKQDGTITLIEDKTFVAAGKTRGELEKEIHDTYVPKYYLKMTVSIQQKDQTQFYYVRGEVRTPNRQIYISRIHLLEAIASSGDFTDFARRQSVKLTRTDGRQIIINCNKARKDPRLNLEILPGDIIDVPRRNPFF